MATPRPPSELSLRQSRAFGRYELLFRLAKGGMGEVYAGRLAGMEGFEKLLAIKLIHPEHLESSIFVEMFIDEARLLARISHPNVVQVMDLGIVDGIHFIAMEYVHGESLAALIHRTRIPFPVCARIVSDAAQGLHAAHELRSPEGQNLEVVHRDVSASNILVSYSGVVKITDFGVARAVDNRNVTQVGVVKGRLAYMAPEYLERGAVDRRLDIFGLGVVLYEITTGQRPLGNDLESRRRDTEVVPPSLVVEGYPPELEEIVLRAIHPEPRVRYATALELHTALEHFIVGSGTPVLGTALGELMAKTFSARIEKKRNLLYGESAGILDLPTTTERSPTVQARVFSNLELQHRRKQLILGLSALLFAVAAGSLVTYALLPDISEGLPHPARPRSGEARVLQTLGPPPVPDVGPRPPDTRGQTAIAATSPDLGVNARAPIDQAVSVRAAPRHRPLAPHPARPRSPQRKKLEPPVASPKAAPAKAAPAKAAPAKAAPAKAAPQPARDDLFGNPFEKKKR